MKVILHFESNAVTANADDASGASNFRQIAQISCIV